MAEVPVTTATDRRIRAMGVVRLVLTAAVVGALAWLDPALDGVISPTVLRFALLAYVATAGASLLSRPPLTRIVLDVTLIADAGGLACLLAATGGLVSPFVPVAVLVVAAPTMVFGVRTGLRAVVATTLVIGWVWAVVDTVPDAAVHVDARAVVLVAAICGVMAATSMLTPVVERDLRGSVRDLARIREIARDLDPRLGAPEVARRATLATRDLLGAAGVSLWARRGDGDRRWRCLASTSGDAADALVHLDAPPPGAVRWLPVGDRPASLAAVHGACSAVLVGLAATEAADTGAPAPAVLVVEVTTSGRDGRFDTLLRLAADEAAAAIVQADLQAELRALATTDGLTGIANHRQFQQRLSEEMDRHVRRADRGDPADLSLVLFDLDHFKAVNDAYGHPSGDAVLAAVASAVAGITRASDVLARYGGEEFAVLLPDTDVDGAARTCERMRRTIRDLVLVAEDGRPLPPISASFGVATAVGDRPSSDALIEAADRALYRAKRAGRDRVVTAGGIEVTSIAAGR